MAGFKNAPPSHYLVARDAFAITPNDSTDLAKRADALYVAGAGDVKVDTWEGNTVTIPVPANFILPMAVKRVHDTDTTATDIFGMVFE
jgi:hypothetical protein